MKKSLLALAVMGAFAGVAHAQSAVTIYGSFDGGVRYTTNQGPVGPDSDEGRLTMGSNGTFQSNRIGFRGVEDLGGGMNAHFNLETGFNTGTGELNNTANRLFDRTASVGFGGTWGSLDFGRQYSANFRTIGTYDPFNYKYTGIIPLAGQGGITRFNNSIQYTGKFGPVTARVDYALGEQVGSLRDGSSLGGGVVYAAGPFSVGGAYTNQKIADGATFSDHNNWTVGGAWTTGPIRVAAGYADSNRELVAGDLQTRDAWLGASYNLTPAMAVTAAYYHRKADNDATGATGKQQLGIVGLTYALSKRTNFYADVDYAKYKDALIPANGEDNRTGVSVGINHLF
ncbi:MAG: porin [Noviherbaspirillum sp.]